MNQEAEKVVGQTSRFQGGVCVWVGGCVLCAGMTLQGEGLCRWLQLSC